jgi:hypothetical protein
MRWVIATILAAQFAAAEPSCPTCAARSERIDIEIAPNGWGGAELSDIHVLLVSVASQFPLGAIGIAPPPIYVFYSTLGNPIILAERTKHNKVQIALGAGARYWAQYSFQFSHEFVHVLVRHMDAAQGADAPSTPATWLEESLAEVGSLFALRAMAREWKTQAPYPNWTSYSEELTRYSQEIIEQAETKLSAQESFLQWFESQQSHLQGNAHDRPANSLIAVQMLPLFEQSPETWATLLYFSRADTTSSDSSKVMFAKWAAACPDDLRPHVERLAALFEG